MRVRLGLTSMFFLLLVIATTSYAESWPGECFIKFRGDPQDLQTLSKLQPANPEIAGLFRQWQVSKAEQYFPTAVPPERADGIELRTWWKLYVPVSTDIDAMVAAFEKSSAVVEGEPSYVYKTYESNLTYNDPKATNAVSPENSTGPGQWGLYKVHAGQAHDYCTGNDSIIIAIVDTGVDWHHPDLLPNMWTDSAGHHGANLLTTPYGTDPLPVVGGDHGTHCAGLASASTNNGTGVASIGYRCKIMGVRTGSTSTISEGYPGIQWAADHHADIISCSWGGTSTGAMEQQAINYAWGPSHNCVILCAAGNDYDSTLHYPAAYDNVIAVAASDHNDHKSDFSCYGSWVDVTSPGTSILSTIPSSTPGAGPYTNAYTTWDGTSMATPFAAGLAALIKSRMGLNAINSNIRDVLFASCVPIDTINFPRNSNGISALGHGRIDALQAMLALNAPEIHYLGQQMTYSGSATRLVPGGSSNLSVYLNVLSAFAAVDSGHIHVVCTNPGITFTNSTINFNHIDAGANWDNEANPFQVNAASNMAPGLVTFRVQVFAQPSDFSAEFEFDYYVGWEEALIVDGDNGSYYQSFYDSSLTSLGISHEVYNLSTLGSIPDGYLNNFHWVIWETGDDSLSPLDSYHQGQISNYVMNNGKILLSSQFLTRDLGARSFLANVVHAVPLHDNTANQVTTITPVTNNGIGLTGSYYIIGGSGASNGQLCQYTLSPDSTGQCQPCYNLGQTGEACGVYRQYGNGEIIFFSIAMEAISVSSQTGTLSDLLSGIRTHFFTLDAVPETSSRSVLPKTIQLGQAYPNPFNATTSLSLAIPATQNVTLTVYDQLGREKMHEVYHNLTAGDHRISITLPGASSGVYFAQVRTATGTTLTRKLVYLR